MSQEVYQPVLIDTPIGDDVDSVFALALACSLPTLRLCGVTTICSPVHKRACLAQVILSAAGQPDIPVVPGNNSTNDGYSDSNRFCYQSMLNTVVEMPNWYKSTTSDLILRQAQENNPLTLIALGPLTNIAAALRRDITLAQRVRLVAMIGRFGFPYTDWNLRYDPAAVQYVLASGMPITFVGANVARCCKLRTLPLRHLFTDQHPLSMILLRCMTICRTWKQSSLVLPGTSTVAVAADPTLARQEFRQVRVVFTNFSIASRSDTPNASICTSIDVRKFYTLFDSYLFSRL